MDKNQESKIKKLEEEIAKLKGLNTSLCQKLEEEKLAIKNTKELSELLSIFLNDLSKHDNETPNFTRIIDVLLKISGAKYGALNLIINDQKEFKTVAFSGTKNHFNKAKTLMGFDFEKKIWKFDESRYNRIKGNIITRFESLTDLTQDAISKSIVSLVQNTFNLGEVNILNLTMDEVIYGDITLFFVKGAHLQNKELVHIFSNQLSNYFSKNRQFSKFILNESIFHALFNTMEEGVALHELIFSKDKKVIDYRIIDTNPAFEVQLSLSAESVMHKTSKEAYSVEHPPFLDIYTSVAQTGIPQTFETYFAPLKKHFLVSAIRIKENSFATLFKDITVLKLDEQKLKASEEKYRELAELLPQIVFEVDSNGIITYVNKQANKILGYPETYNLMGTDSLNLYIPEDKMRVIEGIERTRLGLKPINYEYSICKLDGGIIKMLIYSSPIFNNDQFNGIRGIAVDITKRKEIEEEIRIKNQQLEKLNAEKDRFFSIIAHDLRSPFNGFLGLTELMATQLQSLSQDDIKRVSSSMFNSASSLFQLLENLLTWSRMQQGLIPFNPVNISLWSVIDKVIDDLFEQHNQKNIEVIKKCDSQISISADKNMIESLLRNLISNAIKFTNKGGKVTIFSTQTNLSTTITIKDTGIGLSQEMIEDVFLLDSKSRRKGTEGEASSGLGLLLCKEFIERHNGTISIESEVEKGTSFIITIPNQ